MESCTEKGRQVKGGAERKVNARERSMGADENYDEARVQITINFNKDYEKTAGCHDA